jgi:hypothetical protein
VSGNTVAWNGDGIVVLSQDRSGSPAVAGNHVHDNVVALAPQPGDGTDAYAVAWLADWGSPMFQSGSDNLGTDNAVVLVGAGSDVPFAWAGSTLADPAAFAGTPGGAGLRMLDDSGARQQLAAAGVPTDPIPTVAYRPLTKSEVIVRVVVALAAAGVLVLLLVGALVRRRRRRGVPPAGAPQP